MPINLKDFTPKTLEEAINYLYEGLDDNEKKVLSDKNSMERKWLHHGAMMTVRNEWGLWTESALRLHFIENYGLGHADDMSGLIQDGLLTKIDNEPFDPELKAAGYRRFWYDQKIDPLTQRNIK